MLVVDWLQHLHLKSLHDFQCLLGKLHHAISCAPAARVFLNRLQADLRAAVSGPIPISEGAKRDLNWLRIFLTDTNGLHLLQPARETANLQVDASGKGFGAIAGNLAYAVELPPWFAQMGFHATQLECLNFLLALRVFHGISVTCAGRQYGDHACGSHRQGARPCVTGLRAGDHAHPYYM